MNNLNVVATRRPSHKELRTPQAFAHQDLVPIVAVSEKAQRDKDLRST